MNKPKSKKVMLMVGLCLGWLFAVLAAPPMATAVTGAWVRVYNGNGNASDEVTAMTVGIDGSVYVTGRSMVGGNTFDYFDYVTIKYAPDGDKVWEQTYNGIGNNYDVPTAIAVDNMGNVYVTGASAREDSMAGAAHDFLTVKYSSTGQVLWKRRYNGSANSYDAAWDIAVDESGVYVTGRTTKAGTIFGDYATLKYSPAGKVLWIRYYNGPADKDDDAYALDLDLEGNVYVTGGSSNGTNSDFVTVKYSPDGQRFWVRRYDGPSHGIDHADNIVVDTIGNVYVAGRSWNSESRSDDYATVKYTTRGELQWVRRYDGPGKGDDVVEKIAADGDGNCYVTGWSMGVGTSYDYTTIKYGPSGNRTWVRRYNGPANGFDSALDLTLDDAGNSYVTGASTTSSNGYDQVTIKYDAFGKVVWARRYDGPCKSNDSAEAIAHDGFGNVFVAGTSYCTTSGSDYVVIKYAP